MKRAADALNNEQHVEDPNCECREVGDQMNCKNPHACFTRARQILATLPPKWNPKHEINDAANLANQNLQGGEVVFEKQLIVDGDLSDTFWVFTEGNTANNLPNFQLEGGNDEGEVNITTHASEVHN